MYDDEAIDDPLTDPLVDQRARLAKMRGQQLSLAQNPFGGPQQPNMSMAPGAGSMPPPAGPAPAPAPAAAPAPQRPSSGDLMQQMSEEMSRRPDSAPYIADAKKREEQSNRRLMLSLTLGQMGGEAMQPFAKALQEQSLKDGQPYEIPGGWGRVTSDGVIWNPEKQREAKLAHLQNLYGVQEKADTARLGQQQRSDDRNRDFAFRREMEEGRRDDRREAAADRRAGRADAAGSRAEQQRWRMEDQTRNHFDQITKDTRDVLNTARVLESMPTNGRLTPIQQSNLIILLNKFQDPGSVVREGEFDRVAAAQGLLQKWGNLPAKIQTGQPLPPALQRDIQEAINLYVTAAQNTMRDTAGSYISLARQRGLDPAQVVTDVRWHGSTRPGGDKDKGGGGRGTADSPIKIKPKAAGPGGAPRANVIESDL